LLKIYEIFSKCLELLERILARWFSLLLGVRGKIHKSILFLSYFFIWRTQFCVIIDEDKRRMKGI
jgi:hypothetical protein